MDENVISRGRPDPGCGADGERRERAEGGRRLRIAIVYGGKSAERDVSLSSARAVMVALDSGKYEKVLVAIDLQGRWRIGDPELMLGPDRSGGSRIAILADENGKGILASEKDATFGGIDVLFPLLHGPYGEDGSIQGLARLVDLPCVGADILGSALCMDKDAANRELRASLPGEIVTKEDFYSYNVKYIDGSGAEILAPATLGPLESDACRALALEACRVLCVRGMARVDMFLEGDGRFVVNEVNTIPGFTSRSVFPLLWEASGLSLSRLVDELIELAIMAHAERAALLSTPPDTYYKEGW